jgi:hypothetical protein
MYSKKEIAPGIIVYNFNSIVSNSTVAEIEAAVGEFLSPAEVVNVDNDMATQLMKQYRSCYDYLLQDNLLDEPDNPKKSLLQKVKIVGDQALEDFKNHYSIEPVTGSGWIILKYGYMDKFDWHVDTGMRYPRAVSITVYFNDDYEGGEIEYKHFGISYKPKAGDVIVFCSDFPYLHRVVPVQTGIRYAAVNWFRYATRPVEYNV